MKFCYECGRTTSEEPNFCNFCGRSYDLKFCFRLHANPRTAEACARCGSRDLSRPQPKVSSGWRLVEFLARATTGIALGAFSLTIVLGTLTEAFEESSRIPKILVAASLLTFLWCFWTYLPKAFQRLVRRSLLRKRRAFMDDSA